MNILLDLTHHCIETAAKIKYERLIRQYFKNNPFSKEKIVLEKQISALKYFLEKTDFYDLRNRFDNSGTIEKKAVMVISQHFQDIYFSFNETIFYPNWKNK